MHWQILGRTVNTRAPASVGKHQQTSPLRAPGCLRGPRAPLSVGSCSASPGPGGVSLVSKAGSYCLVPADY